MHPPLDPAKRVVLAKLDYGQPSATRGLEGREWGPLDVSFLEPAKVEKASEQAPAEQIRQTMKQTTANNSRERVSETAARRAARGDNEPTQHNYARHKDMDAYIQT